VSENAEDRLITGPQLQGLVPARVSGFESPLRHQLRQGLPRHLQKLDPLADLLR